MTCIHITQHWAVVVFEWTGQKFFLLSDCHHNSFTLNKPGEWPSWGKCGCPVKVRSGSVILHSPLWPWNRMKYEIKSNKQIKWNTYLTDLIWYDLTYTDDVWFSNQKHNWGEKLGGLVEFKIWVFCSFLSVEEAKLNQIRFLN